MWPVIFRNTWIAARIQGESCGLKRSWTQRLTREFFSRIIFRVAEKNDIGHTTQYLYSFLERRICQICQKTKITTAPRRRRIGGALLRAGYFGFLITADHKVLIEGCVSRNNHWWGVVVQDLATQRNQSYQCKTKTSQKTERSLRKFLELTRKPKIIYTANVLEFGKACEDLSWNHCTSTPHTSETNGIAERAVRRIKEGTSAILLQSGLDEKKVVDSMECYCYLRNIQDILSDGKTLYERRWSGHGIQVAAAPRGGTRRGEGRINVLPWYRLQLDAKEEEPGCPQG